MIPFYSLVLTLVSRSFGTHHPPFKFSNLLKSGAIGGIILLASYALFPKTIQFSRTVILVSSVLFIISSVSIRLLFRLFKIGLYNKHQNTKGRIAIVGSKQETSRIESLIDKIRANHKIYKVSNSELINFKLLPSKVLITLPSLISKILLKLSKIIYKFLKRVTF